MTCHFCNTTSDLETGLKQPGVVPPVNTGVSEGMKSELDAFQAAYAERIKHGDKPTAAFQFAANLAFATLCDPDSMTNVVFGIASDFEKAHGVDVTVDPVVVPRLARAYLTAILELQTHPEYAINLPFLTATADGPLHFSQVVTIARLAELASHPPRQAGARPRGDAPSPGAEATSPNEQSKPWWKRLLG